MKESESYKTYYSFATGKAIPKPNILTRSGKKKQPAKGLETLSEIALSEVEQMKLSIERSKTQLHSSQPSSFGAHEGTGVTPEVPDVPKYGYDEEQISCKSSDEEYDDDEANIGKDEDDDDNDDHDDDDERTESDNDGDDFVHLKLSTYDEEDRHDEEDKEEDSFYPRVQTPSHDESTDDEDSDEKIQGRDIVMTDAPRTILQTTQVIEDTHVIITSVNPEGIDSIFNINTESTSLVDVPVTTIAEPPLFSATTLPPPSTPLITPVSSIPGIVDMYLANKINEAVKIAIQLQSDGLREEAQVENENFINTLDDNIKKIIKEQVKEQVKAQVSKILLKIKKTVNEQLEAEILTRSSNESKTSHAIAANLFELELKKILIDKMESNKSIHKSNEQKNLYKALVDAYENDEDKDEEPSAGSNRGSKRRRAGKEPESTSAPKEKTSKASGKSNEWSKSHHKSAGESTQAEEPIHTAKYLKKPAHQEFKIGVTKDQHDEETSQHPDWFQKPTRPPTPDCDWNKTLPDAHGPVQPWISSLAQMEGPHESFNELMDTPLDFSAFVMNRLKVDTLTPELLTGPTFELMKGSCKSLVELEYFLEEVYKETTDQLEWNNSEGQQYPHDLRKPLPLIPNSHGRQVIPFDHFINNDLAYLSVKFRESARDVYSKHRIIAVTKLEIVEWQNYKHLYWITVRRDDDKLYKFKEGDLKRLRIQDIEDMLLLLIQGKLTNLTVEECLAFNVSLRMFTRSIVIQWLVEDLQLGVKSYQKKLNLTKPDTYRSNLKCREAYSAYSNPKGFIYQNKDKKNRSVRIDELHKFSDSTLNDVQTSLNDRLKGIQMKYLP
ncbi:hypothetical protein Tco_1153138 [Tanacetum coccineum]